ncbi:MAG: hypothetical protein QF797_09430 [Alphaproteobacteria bacterium]|jgi:hypothetical protein|nr:hypothetical protein [Alphaproteobacteria bacterium]
MLHQLHLLFLLMIIGVIGTGPAAAGEKPSFAGARLIRIAHGVSDISLGEGAQRQEFKITRWFSPYNGTSSGSTYRVLFREVDESTGKVTWGGIPIKWHSSSARQHPIYPSYLETMSSSDIRECNTMDIRLLVMAKGARQELLLLDANRVYGDSISDPNIVEFLLYVFVHDKSANRGQPRYYFKPISNFESEGRYCNVNEAFEKEFGF